MDVSLDILCVEYMLSWPCGQNLYYYYYYNSLPRPPVVDITNGVNVDFSTSRTRWR